VMISAPAPEKPAFAMLRSITSWVLRRPGTCSPVHFKRLELERIGSVPIDPIKLTRAFPSMKPGTSAAIDDISIANSLGFLREVPAVPSTPGSPARSIYGTPIFMISHLDDIVSD
jgi:hypothetical protein